MKAGDLGRTYEDGEYIIQQGEVGYCMYVIQEGAVEIILEEEFGDEYLNGSKVDRAKLGNLVFSNPQAKQGISLAKWRSSIAMCALQVSGLLVLCAS